MPSSFASSHSCAPVLASMNDHGLSFRGGTEFIRYLGTDWPGDVDTRQSTSGYYFLQGSGFDFLDAKKQNSLFNFQFGFKGFAPH